MIGGYFWIFFARDIFDSSQKKTSFALTFLGFQDVGATAEGACLSAALKTNSTLSDLLFGYNDVKDEDKLISNLCNSSEQTQTPNAKPTEWEIATRWSVSEAMFFERIFTADSSGARLLHGLLHGQARTASIARR